MTALVLGAAAFVLVVVTAVDGFPRGPLIAAMLVLVVVTGWEAIRRVGRSRTLLAVVAVVLLAAMLVVLLSGGVLVEVLLAGVLFVLATGAARRAFRLHVALPPAPPPSRAVVVWNPRSGGGKAAAANLDAEARARGIEPIELRPGDDLLVLVRDAVARGADALAAAGGDGTQALVAGVAAEHDLPFACVPAGTRNHFALDLGVDRDDVVGALDAFVSGGGERRVDLAEVNGRVFVNNVSLGLYAEAVQRPGYRDAKLRMMLDTVPEFVGPAPSDGNELRFVDASAAPVGRAIVVQVSNNSYLLGTVLGSGTRPRIDDGRLGIAVLAAPVDGGSRRPTWRQWTAATFEVGADGPVPAGVDGEAMMIDPPLRFTMRPGALRVRIAPQHPGASPSAAVPLSTFDAVRQLVHIARTGAPGHP
ncbi:MAG: diacylglycerol kinase family protein [Ilumatobacteraceae bacterium]